MAEIIVIVSSIFKSRPDSLVTLVQDVRASEEVNGRNGFPTGPSGVDKYVSVWVERVQVLYFRLFLKKKSDSWRRSERPANSRPQEDFSVRSSRGAHHRTLGKP